MKSIVTCALCGVLPVLGLAGATASASLVVKDQWDFGTDVGRDGNGGFSTFVVTRGAWTTTSNALEYSRPTTGTGWYNYGATKQFEYLTTGQDFKMELTVKGTSTVSGNASHLVGFYFLGSVGDSSIGDTNNGLEALFRPYATDGNPLQIRNGIDPTVMLLQGGGTWTSAKPDGATGATYTMTLVGDYEGDLLTMTFTVTDGTNTVSVTGTGSATAMTGQYFGFGGRQNHQGAVWDFQSLTVSIPEPTSFGLVIAGAAIALTRRVRKHVG